MEPPPSDQNLLQEFVSGEGARAEGAFDGLVRRHGGMVRASILRRVKNRAVAEEAAQAVFLVLANKAPELVGRGMGAGEGLGGWLLKTARYAGIDAMRKEMRQLQHERRACLQRPEVMAAPENLDADENDPRLAALDDALLALTTQDREAVVLRYFQQQSFARIAISLGTTEAAARKRMQRALKKLRALMTRHGEAITPGGIAGLLAKSAANARASAVLHHGIAAIAEAAKVQWRAGRIVRRLVEAKWRLLAAVSAAAMLMVAVGILIFGTAPEKRGAGATIAQGVVVAPPGNSDGSTLTTPHNGAGLLSLNLSNDGETLPAPPARSRGFFAAVLQMNSLALDDEDTSPDPPDRVTCLVLGISGPPHDLPEVEWAGKQERLTLAAGSIFFTTTTREIQEHMLSLAWLPAIAASHATAHPQLPLDGEPAEVASEERDRANDPAAIAANAAASGHGREREAGGITVLAVVALPRLFHF